MFISLPILTQPFWRDEVVSVLIAQYSPVEIVHRLAIDLHPPLYFLLLHFWMLLVGTSEVAVRSLSVVFGIMSFLSFVILSKLLLSTRPQRIFAQIIFVLNPFFLFYLFEARAYSLLMLLVVSCAVSLLRKKYFLASLAIAAAIATHYFALFFLVGFGLWLVCIHVKKNNKRQLLSFFTLPLITIFCCSFMLFPQASRVHQQYWIEERSIAMVPELLRSFFVGNGEVGQSSWLFVVSYILLLVSVGLFVVHVVRKKNVRFTEILLLSLFLVPLLLTFLVSNLWKPLFYPRYLLPSLPFCLLFIVYELEQIRLGTKQKTLHFLVWMMQICYFFCLLSVSLTVLNTPTKQDIQPLLHDIFVQHPNDRIICQSPHLFLETK